MLAASNSTLWKSKLFHLPDFIYCYFYLLHRCWWKHTTCCESENVMRSCESQIMILTLGIAIVRGFLVLFILQPLLLMSARISSYPCGKFSKYCHNNYGASNCEKHFEMFTDFILFLKTIPVMFSNKIKIIFSIIFRDICLKINFSNWNNLKYSKLINFSTQKPVRQSLNM